MMQVLKFPIFNKRFIESFRVRKTGIIARPIEPFVLIKHSIALNLTIPVERTGIINNNQRASDDFQTASSPSRRKLHQTPPHNRI